MLTLGVEEEFLLLEPTGAVAPVAPAVVADPTVGGQVKTEFMTFQVETATPVCTTLDELRTELARLRLVAADAAGRAGARLVAAGLPPFGARPLEHVTPEQRYLDLARRFPWAVAASGACACQVHIGIPDRELAAEVVARLRPWLAPLLALTGNSPVAGGADTGWSSRRYVALLRWPTFRPPHAGAGATWYDRTVQALIARGAAGDQRSVYFLARLSPRYPTVEVRVPDTCLTTEDAVLLAGVVRGLVATLLEEARQGPPARPLARSRVRADLLSAAHHGMAAAVAGRRGRPGLAGGDFLARLHATIRPALEASGDAEEVAAGLERLGRTGTGADRQRQLWAGGGSPRAFVAALADAAVPVAPRV